MEFRTRKKDKQRFPIDGKEYRKDYGYKIYNSNSRIDEKDYLEYQDQFGVGPCLPVSVVLRERGYGHIEVGQFGVKGNYLKSFPHYWIRSDKGEIIDLTNPDKDDKNKTYWDIEKIRDDEKGEDIDPMVYGEEDFDFWRKRL